jgi:hypothetical protein
MRRRLLPRGLKLRRGLSMRDRLLKRRGKRRGLLLRKLKLRD